MKNFLKNIVKFFSSLKLTVGLLAFATLLIFVATLDQSQNGLRHAQSGYIENWIGSPIPIPGGYLIGALVIVNLLFAYKHLLKGQKIPFGIFCIHTGILLLVISSFIAGWTRTEGQLWIREGEPANVVETTTESELVIVEDLTPATNSIPTPNPLPQGGQNIKGAVPPSPSGISFGRTQKTYSVPAKSLEDGQTIVGFPAKIKILKFLPNAQLGPRDKNESLVKDNDALIVSPFGHLILAKTQLKSPQGYLKDSDWLVFEKKETFAENEVNAVTAVVNVEGVGEFIVSNLLGETFMPQHFALNGHRYSIALRLARRTLPFALKLNKFTFERYQGTDIPKNFASDVEVMVNKTPVRRAIISMNNPLRFGGYTFYQASFDQVTEKSTMLMAVKNDTDFLPYLAVALVGFGLLWHFAKKFVT